MLHTRTTISILILVVLAAVATLGGCGGDNAAGGVYTAPAFYAQMARAASAGGWAQLLATNGVVTAPVGSTVRVFVDSGDINTLTVRNPATGKDEPYIAGAQVIWPAGTWVFKANVTKQGKMSDLVLTLTIAPTQLTDFRISAMVGNAPIAQDPSWVVRLPEGVSVYYWIGGAAYPLSVKGGFGGIGGDGIVGSFWRNTATSGLRDPIWTPTTIPFTQGDGYNLYHPLNGEYLAVASFPFEEKPATTAPLHFTVGPHYEQ